MTNRGFGEDSPEQFPVTEFLAPMNADDEFLSALAAGDESLRGSEPLADLFLDFNESLSADVPAPPSLAELGIDAGPATDEFPAAAGGVASLDKKRKSRRMSNWASGLIGAAAATLVIAGAGTAISSAGTDSPLYGLNQKLFGGASQQAVIELASTLEEANKKSEAGDQEGARQLLDEARNIVKGMKPKDRPQAESDIQRSQDNIEKQTVTTTVTEPAPSDPSAVTVTATAEPEASPQNPATPQPAPVETQPAPVPPVAPVQTPTPVQPVPTDAPAPGATPTNPELPLNPPEIFN